MSQQFTPHDYQFQIMDWIARKKRCAVWAGMGAGKTVSTLTALDNLSLVEPVFPVLVLAPLRVARTVWAQECQKWAHLNHLKVNVIGGLTVKHRAKSADTQADIHVINYEMIPWLMKHFAGRWPFRTIVADELTRLKSFRLRQGGQRASALGKAAFDGVDRFIGLTGTPGANGLKDLWGQIWFIDQGQRLGRTFSAFEQRWFCKGYDGYSLEPRSHAQEEIQKKLRDICLTVDGLPVDEPIFNTVQVPFPRAIESYYRELERTLFTEIAGNQITAANAAVKAQKLMQLANGAIYIESDGEDGKPWEEVHAGKLDALESIVTEANGNPVLVAYNFKSDLARIRKRFPQARVLDTDPDTIRDWNAGRVPLLVAHPASAGHGLNLAQGGNILAFFGLNWSLELYQQMLERLGPMRQRQAGLDRPVFVHHIVMRNSIDELVMERLRDKREVQDILLDAMRRAVEAKRFSTKETAPC